MTTAELLDCPPPMANAESDAIVAEAEIRAQLEGERDSLMRFAMSRTGRRAEAEDLVQETMLRALRFASSYRPGTHLRGWLKTILRNSWINHVRTAAIRPSTIASEDGPLLFSSVPDRSASAEPIRSGDFLARRDEVDGVVHAAIAQLSPEHRDVLLLSVLDGYSHREIAERLDIPEGTVMSRLFRARKAARGLLAA